MEKREIHEVRCDFYDDVLGGWAVDCWFDDDDNSEGQVVAYVFDDGSMSWQDPQYKGDALIMSEVKMFLEQDLLPMAIERVEQIKEHIKQIGQ